MRYAIFFLPLLTGPSFAAEPVYTWHTRVDDPDRVYLYRDGKQVGGWCYQAKQYRSLDGDTWGPPVGAAPAPPPARSSVAPMMSWQSSPRRRGLRGRIDASLDEAMRNYVNSPGFLSGLKLDLKLEDSLGSLSRSLYHIDLDQSVRHFAHLEMGGKLDDKTDSDRYQAAQELMKSGSLKLFLSERATFADKLKEEGFSQPVLGVINLELEADEPTASKSIGSQPEEKPFKRLLYKMPDWRADAPSPVAPNTPAIPLLVTHKARDAKNANPVTVHCSFVFVAVKEGRVFFRILSFDVFFEKLGIQEGTYPWKVKNVEYK